MAKVRVPIPEQLRLEIIEKCNNRCCVCQTPFVQIHHIDEDPSNNTFDNLVALCPNCHSQAPSRSHMTVNLTEGRLKQLRDRWYAYCEARRAGSNVGANAMLKLKNFVRSVGFAQYGWSKTFAAVDSAYGQMTRDQVIDHVFATTNRDDLVTYLETVKCMYQVPQQTEDVINRFADVCNAFGIDYSELR